jgi:hypothetical protein
MNSMNGLSNWANDFLGDRDNSLRWTMTEAHQGFTLHTIFRGQGADAVEVAVATALTIPGVESVRRLWKARHASRRSPVLLVVGYAAGEAIRIAVCGPSGGDPPVAVDVELGLAERLARAVLGEPDRHSASRRIQRRIPELESGVGGVSNNGLLATHELRRGVPTRSDWRARCDEGRQLLQLSGRELVRGLGFTVEQLQTNASVLIGRGSKRAVALFLDDNESFDAGGGRFDASTPVSFAIALAEQENLPWVVLTRSSEIRLYSSQPEVGVGRKGVTQTFVEISLDLLAEDDAGYLPLLFGEDALKPSGSLYEILGRSADFAADLATQLRERVYFDAVPRLATAISRRLGGVEPSRAALDDAYEQTLVLLFRMLFIAYAEDKELLPYRTNSRYEVHSLKRIARQLVDEVPFDAHATDYWEDFSQLCRAIHDGQVSWDVPAYGGSLFSPDPDKNPAGAALANLKLTDEEFGPVLRFILVLEGDEGAGPIDFRSLSVREFGTIYEGLLESELTVAETDLVDDGHGGYAAAPHGTRVDLAKGQVYFHNRSGSRKSSGSFFTKDFAVRHLLDHALEPALTDHLGRIETARLAGDEAKAAELFFDFRCVDLAMGSGHFLVAAVDRIDHRLGIYLARHPIPLVVRELEALKATAIDKLGDSADRYEGEFRSLLRRLVARRCVYGVDRNRIAVELSRLSLWIHSFVPGLPLSFLDHNLVEGDSLTGVGTLDEVLDALEPGRHGNQPSLFREQILDYLRRAEAGLKKLALSSERTKEDVDESWEAHRQVIAVTEPAARLFDVIAAARIGEAAVPENLDEASINAEWSRSGAGAVAERLRALHLPVAFPEVVLRTERPGFDVILGNPPWEEATVEELNFWSIRFPGLKSMNQADQRTALARLRADNPGLIEEYASELQTAELTRRALVAGPYPGMGTGDPDTYKAFAWRFWQLLRDGGAIGVVLPRSALSAAGSTPWRNTVIREGAFTDVTMILNNMQWMFEDVHPQYTVGLVTIRKGTEFVGSLSLSGPYRSRDRYDHRGDPARFSTEEFLSWSENASFPLLPDEQSAVVFAKLRKHPRLAATVGDWQVRATTEFHATADKGLFDLSPKDTNGLWPVYKGASFNLWQPDTGTYYAWAQPKRVVAELQAKRARSARRSGSPYAGFASSWIEDVDTLPCLHPRIVFRDIARATDNRTMIAALVPANLVLTNKAPYFLFPRGDESDQAFLLGVLCSMPFDWYTRRVVEISLNFHLVNGFPVPRPDRDNPLRREVVQLAGRLAASDERFAQWAESAGVSAGLLVGDAREDAIARLDAAVGLLYDLEEEDLATIYETFHENADYTARWSAVREHFRALR